jgi:hypothetical protein
MIAIQILLLVGILILFGWFLANPRSYQVRAWTKIFTLLFAVIALVFILFPNSSNHVANWFGVGRGVDLLSYLLSLAFIYLILRSYIREKEEQKRIVQLGRRLAILEANERYHKKWEQ